MASKTEPAQRTGHPETGVRATAITGLSVKGFKSIRDEITIRVRGLTLLAGSNSAGKSSALQPLLLMKQTIEATHDPGPLLLDGPCVKISRSQELFWQGTSRRARSAEWSAAFHFSDSSSSRSLRTSFGIHDGQLVVNSTTYGGFGVGEALDSSLTLHRDMSHEELLSAVELIGAGPLIERGLGEPVVVVVRQEFGLLVMALESQRSGLRLLGIMPTPFGALSDVIHLPGLRGNAERTYPIAGAHRRYPGPFPAYTASILNDWHDKKDPRLSRIGVDLAHLGLTWKVAPRRVDDTRVELRVGRLPAAARGGANDLVNIADVGVGTSQVLPVLVALHAAQPGQVVHIEQPEIHLHPNAQVKMADLLVAASNRGVRVIVETHSSVLLRAVQLAVANGEMPADDVALYWFHRQPDGATKMTPGRLGRDGAYGDWPVDFADVEMALDEKFIEAAFRQIEPA